MESNAVQNREYQESPRRATIYVTSDLQFKINRVFDHLKRAGYIPALATNPNKYRADILKWCLDQAVGLIDEMEGKADELPSDS